ncbi:PTS sugar transporter subunit IIB [Desulfonatronospira sp.]|uniref:PTS sugar transporter subunit IIB n=1 Tax=Desulfonatronospira sp. TaxID=1962951 RepID=UPI0025C5AC12|nr:PTS sugar transporter subunit IIB [Desulfonatronospira sp.]
MFWVRIDNRLVHGQVIETWLPYAGTRALVVVNDDLAADPVRQEIMGLAVPSHIEITFSSVQDSARLLYSAFQDMLSSVFILFDNCHDARKAFDQGVNFSRLNIGNIHYGPGKKQVCSHIALSQDDTYCLEYFSRHGVRLDFRCVPHKSVQVDPW